MANIKTAKKKSSKGSTLILAVVLTSMLAIIGTLFVLVSRVDRISTSAITEDKEIEYAVESVIAKLSEQLILDVPGMAGQEYYDYPNSINADAWLASLEPYVDDYNTPGDTSDDIYRWRQISDVTGFLTNNFILTGNEGWSISEVYPLPVKDNTKISSEILDPNGNLYTPPITDVTPSQLAESLAADADGDGVSDSKWVQLDSTSKGKPVFAAVRVVDNCGMLNINTGYKFATFDVNGTPYGAEYVDGSRLAQIHLMDIYKGITDDANDLHRLRCNGSEPDLVTFNDQCARRIENPDRTNIKYLPYDIGDELELRNRYLLDARDNITRIESALPITLTNLQGRGFGNKATPVDSETFDSWKKSVDPNELNLLNDYYDFRHVMTTNSADQIVANKAIPDANVVPMININKSKWIRNGTQDEVYDLYRDLESSIDPNLDPYMNDMDADTRWKILQQYAQLATNIADFADEDTQVTVLNVNDVNYFGYEARPYISEVGMVISNYPETGLNYYAVELYNPSDSNIYLSEFSIDLINSEDPNSVPLRVTFDDDEVIYPNGTFLVSNNLGAFYKHNDDPDFWKQDPNLRFFDNWEPPDRRKPPVVVIDPPRNRPHYVAGPDRRKPPIYIGWKTTYDMLLRRWIDTGKKNARGEKIFTAIYVDKQYVSPDWAYAGSDRYFGRDARTWHIAYQTVEEDLRHRQRSGRTPQLRGSLGKRNSIDPEQFEQYNHRFSFLLPGLYGVVNPKFVTVGDVPRLLMIGDSDDYTKLTVGERLMNIRNEDQIRLNLRNPYYRNIFQYLTVFDPTADSIDNDDDGIIDGVDINGDGVIRDIDINGDGIIKNVDTDGDGIIDIIEVEVDSDERAVPGRININTAPWYVIAQLPWMTEAKAKAIVAYRDKLEGPVNYAVGRTNAVRGIISLPTYTPVTSTLEDIPETVLLREEPGFASIGELNFVVAPDANNNIFECSMQQRGIDGSDLGRSPFDNPYGYPDLTTDGAGLGDGITDDFEEKDVIFSRISNLVTVRSDLFTAYILVRIGADGPQKRAIAILDRSNVTTVKDKVELVALHYVPDPR